MNCLAISGSFLLLAATCASQNPGQLPVAPLPARGVLSTFQMGMLFDDDLTRIALRRAGRRGLLDVYPGVAQGNVIDASGAAINGWIRSQPGWSQFGWQPAFDALSTYSDNLPIELFDPNTAVAGDEYYRPYDAGQDSWAMLELAVEAGTIRATNAAIDNATTLGYYFQNSGFPSQLQNGVYHEILRPDFTSGSVPAPSGTVGIRGLDAGLGFIEASDGVLQPGILECVDKLYFSVTPASAALLRGLNYFTARNDEIDGATIFEVTFSTTGANYGEVVNFQIFRTYVDLGVPMGADIDALAMAEAPYGVPQSEDQRVHRIAAGQPLLVVSFAGDPLTLAGAPVTDQLWVVARTEQNLLSVNDPLAMPGGQHGRALRDAAGGQLVGPVGTLTGNVKGVCNYDPEGSFRSITAAFPDDDAVVIPRMILSAAATQPSVDDGWDPTVVDRFTLHGSVSGWGTMPAQQASMLLWIEVDGTPYWRALPPRGAAKDVYDFELELEFPRDNAPGNGGINDYRFCIVSAAAVSPTQAYYSPFMLLHREAP